MTAFTPSQIPSNVNSVEKLAVWCHTILNHLYPTEVVQEAEGNNGQVLVAQTYIAPIVLNNAFQFREISRFSIGIIPNWQRNGKPWTFALDIGTSNIPTEFTQP